MATGLLYRSIAEKENLSNLAIEKKVGLPNGTVGRAIERNSTIKPSVFAQIAKAFPHLDLNQMQIELLAPSKYAASRNDQLIVSEPKNENAPSGNGQGERVGNEQLANRAELSESAPGYNLKDELIAALKQANAALEDARNAWRTVAEERANWNAVANKTQDLDARLIALHATVPELLSPVLQRLPNDIAGEIHRAYEAVLASKRKGTLAGADR